jgi:5,10-methenyltetrahydromethanopterin hydrogenase
MEACSKFDVENLSIGDFHLQMKGTAKSHISGLPKEITVSDKVNQTADEIEQQTELATQINQSEEDHLRLVVEDPEAWEKKTLELMREGSD